MGKLWPREAQWLVQGHTAPCGRAGLDVGSCDSWAGIALFSELCPSVVARGVGKETGGNYGKWPAPWHLDRGLQQCDWLSQWSGFPVSRGPWSGIPLSLKASPGLFCVFWGSRQQGGLLAVVGRGMGTTDLEISRRSPFSRVRLCATPWTAAHQAPLSTGFSRQEYWSGLPFPSPRPWENWFHLLTLSKCVCEREIKGTGRERVCLRKQCIMQRCICASKM